MRADVGHSKTQLRSFRLKKKSHFDTTSVTFLFLEKSCFRPKKGKKNVVSELQ